MVWFSYGFPKVFRAGRILEFLAEGEAERARLWYQMSVPRHGFMLEDHIS
jgi:hypothetical protein